MQTQNKAFYISPSGKLVEQTFTYTFESGDGDIEVLTEVSLKQEIH